MQNNLVEEIIAAALEVHLTLGPGLSRSVYETALSDEVRHRGFDVQNQVPFTYSGSD